MYLFNGLEQRSGDVTIIQPVLGWNADYGSGWGIAELELLQERHCPRGHAGASQSRRSSLRLYLQQLFCGNHEMLLVDHLFIGDLENGNTSVLVTSNFGQTFNWAFGGVLEVYYITQCSDYPPATNYLHGIGFYNQTVLNDEFVSITPAWGIHNVSSGLTPQCSYGGSLPKQVILTY